jgi:hypothetical protein
VGKDYSLSNENVDYYEIVSRSNEGNSGNALLGAALFGVTGAIIGSSSKQKQSHIVSIIYRLGKIGNQRKSTIEINDNFYKIFVASQGKKAKPIEFIEQPTKSNLLNPTTQIRELKQLFDEGILTEEEFATKKIELLSRI